MRFKVNEWLLHDLHGDNGPESQLKSAEYLQELVKKRDQIVVPLDSPWMQKAFDLMNRRSIEVSTLSKYLHSIINNLELCERIHPAQFKPLPASLQDMIDRKLVDSDDTYLLQTYYSSNDIDFLVTSDVRLHNALSNVESITTVLKADFLRDYLS